MGIPLVQDIVMVCSLVKAALGYALEGEGDELEALATVEFVLELHPRERKKEESDEEGINQ